MFFNDLQCSAKLPSTRLQEASETAQHCPKKPPRPRQTTPRWPPRRPRSFRDCPGQPQETSRTLQDRPKTPPRAPRATPGSLQDPRTSPRTASKTLQNRPETLPGPPRLGPRGLQGPPGPLDEASKTSRTAPGRLHDPPVLPQASSRIPRTAHKAFKYAPGTAPRAFRAPAQRPPQDEPALPGPPAAGRTNLSQSLRICELDCLIHSAVLIIPPALGRVPVGGAYRNGRQPERRKPPWEESQ